MITFDFTWSMTALISLVPILVMWCWIFYTRHEDQDNIEHSHLEQCPYCTYFFYNFAHKKIMSCPRCQSLISAEQKS